MRRGREPSRRAAHSATPTAVLLEALDSTICSAPKSSLSARKSSSMNDVANRGKKTACTSSAPGSWSGSASTRR